MASLSRIICCSLLILILLFALIIIIILAFTFTGRLSSVLSFDESPVANLGENHLLSCFLTSDPAPALSRTTVTWTKRGVSGVVFRFQNGAVTLQNQSPQFKGRAALSRDELRTGNASLLLSAVRSQDRGHYTCIVSSSTGGGAVTVELRTGAFSAPSFTLSKKNLTAVAERWFPEPRVTWTDLSDTVLTGTTSLRSTGAGVYRLETTLTSINSSSTFILKIENDLKISVSQATIEFPFGVTQQTYLYNTNMAAAPLLPSTQLTSIFSVLFLGLATLP
ncbi:unnamed protein product [Knipowitschia caucasica]